MRVASAPVDRPLAHLRRACTKKICTNPWRVTNNNENLTVRLKIKNFVWRTSYNGHEKDRASAGITNGRGFRSPDDPNDVLILQDVADVSRPAPGWDLMK